MRKRISAFFILIFLTVFLFLLPSRIVTANKLEGVIKMKNTFLEGEEIKAELVVKNLENTEKDILVRAEIVAPFYTSINPQEFFIKLKSFEEKEIEIEWDESLVANKNYVLKITLTEKNETLLLNKTFDVKKREVELFSCLDLECKNQTQIFYMGEKVCLSFSNITPINQFKIIYDGKEENLQLPTCLENLKRGSYQLLAFTAHETYSLNFSVIKPIEGKKASKELNFPYWLPVIVLILILIIIFAFKKKKGQVSFFVKTISIVIASLIFVFIVYYFFSYQRSVAEEKASSEFKNEVLNLAQKLISSEECLSYKNEKGTIDINKLEDFASKYKGIEPECAKEMNFDYTITIVQQPKKIAVLPGMKGTNGTLAWIPNSGLGNSVSLVSSDGREIRRHWTVPAGIEGDPSRTAVDSKGNAWVGNRGTNTLVKIALDKKDCIDKNGDGIIETSEDKNGDGVVDESEMLPFDEDECIVANVRLGKPIPYNIRAVCVDENDNVYAGNDREKKLYYVSSDGKVLKSWDLPQTPYGCAVDKNGIVWIAGSGNIPIKTVKVIRLDPKKDEIRYINPYEILGTSLYTVWPCPNADCVVFTTWRSKTVVKIDAQTMNVIWNFTSPLLEASRGVFVDNDYNVYAVGSDTDQIVKLDKNGKFIKSMPTCSTPTGVSMDSEGNIWVICYSDWGVRIYDKDLNVVSEFTIRGAHYGYSDFTGFQTGAQLGISEVKPSKEIEVEEKIWSFSVGSEKTFGTQSFSPEKAKKAEIKIAIPVTIRYNETFATEGIMYIYAVKGELEEFYGAIDYLCIGAKNFPEREIKFSKSFHFSYPVRMINNKICMLDSCKLVECDVPIKMKEFNSGDYQINFLYDATKKEIDIS
jgi:streptogramin lyase